MKVLALTAALLLASAGSVAAQVGYQSATAADPADAPLPVHVWYPSAAKGTVQGIGPWTHTVAPDAAVSGRSLPLIVISHGTGGSGNNSADLAETLARSGFVVAAVTHTGDNSRDGRYIGGPRQFADRSRHIARVIDHMTQRWPGRDRLDLRRVGVFGYSAGGTTALIAAGGRPDLAQFEGHCQAHPTAFDCRYVAQARAQARAATEAAGALAGPPAPPAPPVWTPDPRVKAAVVVAPALGYTFTRAALGDVRIPVLLWAAEKDEVTPAAWNAATVRANLPRAPVYRVAPGAGHGGFLAPCPASLAASSPDICTDPPGFDRSGFKPGFNRSVAAFFERTLRGR